MSSRKSNTALSKPIMSFRKFQRIVIGVISTGVAVASVFFTNQASIIVQRDPVLWYPIAALQFIGGLLLVVGSLRQNKFLFLPWLFAGTLFVYALLLNSFTYWTSSSNQHLYPFTCLVVSYTLAALWFYCLYVVIVDYGKLHDHETISERLDDSDDSNLLEADA